MAAEEVACDEQHSVKHRHGEICSNFCREKEPWKSWLNLVCVHLVFTFLISGQMQLAVIYDVLVETYEVSKAKVGIVGSLIIVFQSVGGLLGAPALSLLGSRKVSLFASLLLVVGYAGSAYAPNLICFHIFYGVFSGVSFTSMPLVVVHAVGVDNYAKAFSLMEISLLPAAIAAGPFSGWLADISSGYRVVFLFAAGSSLICFTLTLTLLILSLKAKGVHCQKIDCSLQKS